MSQYRFGTANVTNGSKVVIGNGTFWSTNASVANLFEIQSEGVWYKIDSVDNDGQITIDTAYVGTTKSIQQYAIQRDFTVNNKYPIPAFGDIDTSSLIAQSLLQIDAALTALSPITAILQGDIQIDGSLLLSSATIEGISNFDSPSLTLSASGVTQATFDATGLTAPVIKATSLSTTSLKIAGVAASAVGIAMLTAISVAAQLTALGAGAASGLATLDGTGRIPIGQIPASITGALTLKGVWNAATNSPAIVSSVGTLSNYYLVGTAGTTSINGIAVWGVGDWILFNGTAWVKVAAAGSAVASVAGRTGIVVLSAADISGLAPSATLDATNASNITTGALQGIAIGSVTAAAGAFTSLSATGALTVSGVVTLSSTLNVAGATSLAGVLSVAGATTLSSAALSSTLAVVGLSSLTTLTVSGVTALNSTLAVAGAVSLNATLGVIGNVILGSGLAVTGAVTAASFAGDGSALTNLSIVGFTGALAPDYLTRTLAAADTIPASRVYLRIAGYAAAGDCGRVMTYAKVSAQPTTHTAWFRSTDGAYWQLLETEISPRMLGAAANGVTDDHVIIAATDTACTVLKTGLLIDANFAVGASLTIANVTRFGPFGRLTPGSSIKLTFAREFIAAGDAYIFNFSASNSGFAGTKHEGLMTPQNFGAVGDGVSADDVTLKIADTACVALGAPLLIYRPSAYGTTFTIASRVIFQEPGALVAIGAAVVSFGCQTAAGNIGQADPTFMRGYLVGGKMTMDATAPLSTIDFASVVATSDDFSLAMKAPAMTKNTLAAWSAGTGHGALDTVSRVASSWYFVFVIGNIATGAVDWLFSLSPTAPALPTGWTVKRRRGCFKTDGATQIVPFTHVISAQGDKFYWNTPLADVNLPTLTVAQSVALNTPLGIKTSAIVRGVATSGALAYVLMNTLDEPSTVPNVPAGNATIAITAAGHEGFESIVDTDLLQRVRVASTSSTALTATTIGWIDNVDRLA